MNKVIVAQSAGARCRLRGPCQSPAGGPPNVCFRSIPSSSNRLASMLSVSRGTRRHLPTEAPGLTSGLVGLPHMPNCGAAELSRLASSADPHSTPRDLLFLPRNLLDSFFVLVLVSIAARAAKSHCQLTNRPPIEQVHASLRKYPAQHHYSCEILCRRVSSW